MDWLAHDRLGFNYRLSDVAAALGVAQVERLDALLAERDRVAQPLPRAAGRHRGARAALRGPRAGAPQLVRVRRAGAGGGRPRRRDRAPWPRRASPRRPTCRASTSSRSTASGSASGAGSSRSPSGWRRARSRCRSSRRWGRPRWSGCAERRSAGALGPLIARSVLSITCQPRRPGRPPLLPSRRGERVLGLVGLVAAGAVPAWMFRDLLAHLASSFQPDVNWLLTGAIGFALMGVGLLAVAPGRAVDRPHPGPPPVPAQPRLAGGLGREPLPARGDARRADRRDRAQLVVARSRS